MNMMILMIMDLEVRVWSMFFLEVWMIPSPCQLCRKPLKYIKVNRKVNHRTIHRHLQCRKSVVCMNESLHLVWQTSNKPGLALRCIL